MRRRRGKTPAQSPRSSPASEWSMWSVSVFVFVGRLLSELDRYIHLERDIYTVWGNL